MHLALFALAFVYLPPAPPSQQAPADAPSPTATAPPAVARPGTLDLRLGVKSAGTTLGTAAAELERLLASLRDSLRARKIADSAIVMNVQMISADAPTRNHPTPAYEAVVLVAIPVGSFSKLPQIVEVLGGAGTLQLTAAGVLTEDATRAVATEHSVGGRLASIALFLLAVRREVRP